MPGEPVTPDMLADALRVYARDWTPDADILRRWDAQGGEREARATALRKGSAEALAVALQQRDAARNCGQEGVCRVPPGCQRHWEERNRELAAERDLALARATAAEARLTEVIEAAQEIHGSTDEDEALDAWELLYKALPELERPPRFPKRQTRADDLAARLAAQDAELAAARGALEDVRDYMDDGACVFCGNRGGEHDGHPCQNVRAAVALLSAAAAAARGER